MGKGLDINGKYLMVCLDLEEKYECSDFPVLKEIKGFKINDIPERFRKNINETGIIGLTELFPIDDGEYIFLKTKRNNFSVEGIFKLRCPIERDKKELIRYLCQGEKDAYRHLDYCNSNDRDNLKIEIQEIDETNHIKEEEIKEGTFFVPCAISRLEDNENKDIMYLFIKKDKNGVEKITISNTKIYPNLYELFKTQNADEIINAIKEGKILLAETNYGDIYSICSEICEFLKDNKWDVEGSENYSYVYRKNDERIAVFKLGSHIGFIYATPNDSLYYNFLDVNREYRIGKDNIFMFVDRKYNANGEYIESIAKRVSSEIENKLPNDLKDREIFIDNHNNVPYEFLNIFKNMQDEIVNYSHDVQKVNLLSKYTKIKVEKSKLIKEKSIIVEESPYSSFNRTINKTFTFSPITALYIIEAEDIISGAYNDIEKFIAEEMDKMVKEKYQMKIGDMFEKGERIELSGGISIDKNKIMMPEISLTFTTKFGEEEIPILYSSIIDKNGILTGLDIHTLGISITNYFKNSETNEKIVRELHIGVLNKYSGNEYDIKVETVERGLSKVVYVNGKRIKFDELSTVLERLPCSETQKEFDSFIDSVSRLSLENHDILVNGIRKPDSKCIFKFKKEKGHWFIKSTEGWKYIPKGLNGFPSLRFGDAKNAYHEGDYFSRTYGGGECNFSETKILLKGINILIHIYKQLFPMRECLEIIKQAMEEYKVIEGRAEKLLSETMEKLKDSIIRNDKKEVVIKGSSGQNYLIEKNSLRIYRADEEGNRANYVCIVDGKSDAVHLDKFVTRLYVLVNDRSMKKEVHTIGN